MCVCVSPAHRPSEQNRKVNLDGRQPKNRRKRRRRNDKSNENENKVKYTHTHCNSESTEMVNEHIRNISKSCSFVRIAIALCVSHDSLKNRVRIFGFQKMLLLLLTTCDSPQHYRKTIKISWLVYLTAIGACTHYD